MRFVWFWSFVFAFLESNAQSPVATLSVRDIPIVLDCWSGAPHSLNVSGARHYLFGVNWKRWKTARNDSSLMWGKQCPQTCRISYTSCFFCCVSLIGVPLRPIGLRFGAEPYSYKTVAPETIKFDRSVQSSWSSCEATWSCSLYVFWIVMNWLVTLCSSVSSCCLISINSSLSRNEELVSDILRDLRLRGRKHPYFSIGTCIVVVDVSFYKEWFTHVGDSASLRFCATENVLCNFRNSIRCHVILQQPSIIVIPLWDSSCFVRLPQAHLNRAPHLFRNQTAFYLLRIPQKAFSQSTIVVCIRP